MKQRIVASLTTMPDKYNKIVKTLESLRSQTVKLDEIYLTIPFKSKRLNVNYPKISEEIKKLCKIIRYEDFGPITKIIGGLISEENPETIILTFDDDMIYPNNIIEVFLEKNRKFPESAIGSSGMLLKNNFPLCAIVPHENDNYFRISKFFIPEEGRKVDSIYGYPGALYLRGFFPKKELIKKEFLIYSTFNKNVFINDDIVISGFLSIKNIERRIFSDFPEVKHILNEKGKRNMNMTEISYNIIGFFSKMNLAIETCKKNGMYQQTEDVDISETVLGIGLTLIICFLFILIILILNMRDVSFF